MMGLALHSRGEFRRTGSLDDVVGWLGNLPRAGVRRVLGAVVCSAIVASLLAQGGKPKPRPATPGGAYWIWHDEGEPTREAPAETRYFRRVWEINRPFDIVVDEATLDITADNRFIVWINGRRVGQGENWTQVYHFDVKPYLVHGRNVIAVEARNDGGPAGLLVRLTYTPNGQTRLVLYSDSAWKSAQQVSEGWQRVDYDDSKWQAVRVLGPYGTTEPWRQVSWGASERFQVADGFRVEEVVPGQLSVPGIHTEGLDEKLPFSLVNLCFDNRGRLLVAQERGPILLCTTEENGPPRPTPVSGPTNVSARPVTRIRVYCDQVRNCQGMCWAEGALWLVGDGPQGTGLYRCRDVKGHDRVDQVELVHRFEGGMAEHGPHAIVQGPDNFLYLVVGNHAWCQIGPDVAKRWPNPEKIAANSPLLRWSTGRQTPQQFERGHTEDVLLPRQNDARGHAANIRAPGGTIWRLDRTGKRMALLSAGFRNQYDMAFSPDGEIFTFDSDMEWDEGLPWYRPVRICHVTAGSEFGWRTGSSKLPAYYYDTLPGVIDVGRGSPVGVEWHDHAAFPPKYRTLYVSDWSLGIIYAVHLEKQGASYRGVADRFCTGAPMNVTDIAVGPDGALYFSLGGRGTQGGVFRIVAEGAQPPGSPKSTDIRALADSLLELQPYSAFGRERIARALAEPVGGKSLRQHWLGLLTDRNQAAGKRVKIAWVLWQHGWRPHTETLRQLFHDEQAEIRGLALQLLGAWADDTGLSLSGNTELESLLRLALRDRDPRVRRLACETCLRAGWLPEARDLWPVLSESDRFVRTAARLLLQRLPVETWWPDLLKQSPQAVLEGIAALVKIGQVSERAEQIFPWLAERLEEESSWQDRQRVLDLLRATQLVALYSSLRPESAKQIGRIAWHRFPHTDALVNRELAIVLVWAARENLLTESVQAKLLAEMTKASTDRPQQIHYYYCLRLVHRGWTAEQKEQILRWYQNTYSWTGGHSFTPYLANIFRDLLPAFSFEEQRQIVLRGDELWLPAEVVLRHLPESELPAPSELAELYRRLHTFSKLPKSSELKATIVGAISRRLTPDAQAALRQIAELDAEQRYTVARTLARAPHAENIPYLLRGLDAPVPGVAREILLALQKADYKPAIPPEPRAEHAAPFRAVLLAAGRLEPKDRWQAVLVLRRWTGRQFTIDDGDWKTELEAWARWFAQTFPKEPPLPNVTAPPSESKWKLEELLSLLDKVPRDRLDVRRGRILFEKANCAKCHRFGTLGEGIGPDLTTLKGRFTRRDILEAILYPSKVISDQYRGSVILTTSGQTFTGLAAVQGDTITVLQQDGTRITLRKDEVEQMVASTISPMPDKLLDNFTVEEIAELLAFLEGDPPK
ncbi:MAG: c-type cytochrome [Gemmatales bacterium]|nr:c-type cytochrome [Gemmatales bacterium]MDW7993708.1 c-type cytochrome [Gemmatales bacterium]